MAKEIFREKQQFRDWAVYALLVFFILALTYRFVDQNWLNPASNAMTWTCYLLLMAPLAACLWYLLSLRLSVKVTDKYISLKYAPWHPKKHKIKWEDVEECEVLKTTPAAAWSGWNISYNHEKTYSLHGRTGLHLKTKEGEDVIIGVRNYKGIEKAVREALRRERGEEGR